MGIVLFSNTLRIPLPCNGSLALVWQQTLSCFSICLWMKIIYGLNGTKMPCKCSSVLAETRGVGVHGIERLSFPARPWGWEACSTGRRGAMLIDDVREEGQMPLSWRQTKKNGVPMKAKSEISTLHFSHVPQTNTHRTLHASNVCSSTTWLHTKSARDSLPRLQSHVHRYMLSLIWT